MMNELICCFTGHRRIEAKHSLTLVSSLKNVLRQKYRQGFRIFRAGGALGFDTVAALSVLELRGELPEIKLHLILPCKDQDAKWGFYDKKVYRSILNEADAVVYAEESYLPGCMHKRNRMLVNGAQCCIAYYNGSESGKSGTEYTYRYAMSKNIELINLI
jgi:uncharacterized phage-like protein YoqJ